MVNRVGGALELIGLRAVILDIRQYGNSGRQIEQTNKAIGASTEKAAAASANAAAVTQKAMQAQAASAAIAQKAITAAREYAASQSQVAAATTAVAEAEGRLAAERALAAQPRPRDPNTGRFLSQAAVGGRVASAEQDVIAAKASQDALTASMERSKLSAVAWGKAQVDASKNAAKAATDVVRADAAAEAAGARLAAQQEKEAELSAKRGKLVTGTAAIAGGLALAGVGAASIGAASKYQQTLAKIGVLTDATDEQTQKLGQDILNMTKEFPQSPDELGASAYFILSSGITSVSEAQDILTKSAKLATIGQTDAASTARALTTVIVSYGEANITAAQASDILVSAAKQGRAEFEDFANNVGKILPIARAAGVEFDQVAAAMAILTNGGLSAAEAATGLRAILNDLTKSSPQAEAALATVGLTASELRTQIAQDFPKAMENLIRLFKGNLAAIEPIIPNIRGMVAASSAFISQGGKFDEVLTNIQNDAGVTDSAFEKMSKTFEFQKDLLGNQLKTAFIQIGTAVLPTVTESLQDLTRWIDQNKASIQLFIQEGLNVAIEIIKDFASGIGTAIDLLGWLPANEQAIVASVAAIGAAFIWALPGGPLLKGLLTITTLLGALSKEGGFGDKTAQKLNDFFGLGSKGSAQISQKDFESDIKRTGSIEKAIRDRFEQIGGGFGKEIADKMVEDFKAKGVDVSKGVEEFDKALDKLNGTTAKAPEPLKKLAANTDAVEKADEKLGKELQKLAQGFETTSQAAGQFESFTVKLKKFGEINSELAAAFNLDAVAAGNVQGADAVIAAYKRTADQSFEYTKTLATVAEAYRENSKVARDIVLDLARSAQEAAQTAFNTVTSKPTREIANLGVPLAFSRQREAAISLRVNPQIEALNKQLKSIDRAMRDIDKAAKQREKQRKAAEEEFKRNQRAQERLLEDQVDAMKFANLLARQAYERQAELLQDLIDANKKAQADLQAAFLKSNEALQDQINKAIGAGSTQEALSLVEQQRAATKAFREQNLGLQGQEGQLTQQQKDAAKAEAERQRQEALAEALLEQQQKQIKRSMEDAEALFEHQNSTDSDTDAIDAQKEALDNQRQAIQDQIDSLQGQKDAQSEQTARIQEQIDLYASQADILKAQAVAADRTLLTQEQQWELGKRLIEQIAITSGVVKSLSDPMTTLIPEVQQSTTQFSLLKDAAGILRGEFRDNLIKQGIDPAALRLSILATAAEDLTKKVVANATSQQQAGQTIERAAANLYSTVDEIENALRTVGVGGPGGFAFASGGFTPKTGGAIAATLHPNELVLPLNDKQRTADLLSQIIPDSRGSSAGYGSMSNGIVINLPPATASVNNSGPNSIIGALNVQGATLDDMRAVAIRAVNDAFGQAASSASRGGSNISSGASGSANGIQTIGGGGGGGGLVPIGLPQQGIRTIG